MFKNFVYVLRDLFTRTKPEDILVDEEPEVACDMQENKVYVEEVPLTKEEAVCPNCHQDPCTCGTENVPSEQPVTTPKKKRNYRPRKKKDNKEA